MPDPTLRTCDYGPCDKTFPRGGKRRYCCRAHKERARLLRAEGTRLCGWCGHPLGPTYKQRRRHQGCAWAQNRQTVALEHAANGRPLPLDLRLRLLGEPSIRDVARYLATVRYEDPCAYCGGLGGTLDHINAGLRHAEDADKRRGYVLRREWPNLTSACSDCNSGKRRIPPLLFLLAKRLRAELEPLAEQLGIAVDVETDGIAVIRTDSKVRLRSNRGRWPDRTRAGGQSLGEIRGRARRVPSRENNS